MDYHRYIRETFPQERHLSDDRIQAFLSYAQESAQVERERTESALQRQPWLAHTFRPRDDVRFQIDHMLRITGSQAVSLTSEQGMADKSRQLLLITPPGTGSDDTVRGTLYEPWILDQAARAFSGLTPVPQLMRIMGQPINGVTGAPDALFWGKDRFVIIDAKCPRTPHGSAPDAYVAQLHFYEALLRQVLDAQYPEYRDAPIDKLLAQGDILSGRVSFLDIPTVPGMCRGLMSNARLLMDQVIQKAVPWPRPETAYRTENLPEIQKISGELLAIRDQTKHLETQESALKERMATLLGDDPKRWPGLPKDVGGQFRPYWPKTADDKLLAALRDNDIPIPEKPVYDVDGLVQTVRNLGCDLQPFIKDRQVDVTTAVKALEMAGVPRDTFQTPGITLLDKRGTKTAKPGADASVQAASLVQAASPAVARKP